MFFRAAGAFSHELFIPFVCKAKAEKLRHQLKAGLDTSSEGVLEFTQGLSCTLEALVF